MGRIARILRHSWLDEDDARAALGDAAEGRLAARVAASERQHSGEIRVCVEAGLPFGELWRDTTARERAVEVFGRLRVWDTEHNNGVLIYLLLAERQVELVADRGLNRHVDAAHWQRITEAMATAFRGGQFEAGINQAIDAVHALLMQHYAVDPAQANPNELPDAPLFI